MVSTRYIVVQILVLTTIPALVVSYEALNDECYCISATYGCQGDHKMTGNCDRRCCVKNRTGRGDDCKCVSGNKCPDEFPIHNGQCPNLIHCCLGRNERDDL
ncbi:hypothetical protein ACF0H5_023870 [Mactra antiquata]